MASIVILSGPLFSPLRDTIMARGVNNIQRAVAKEADRRVEILHRAFFRHPTPWYWTQVHALPRSDYWVVTDGGIVYGPWLEGTGSRNKTTRFKGYKSFRLATQSLQSNETVQRISAPAVARLCKELNG